MLKAENNIIKINFSIQVNAISQEYTATIF